MEVQKQLEQKIENVIAQQCLVLVDLKLSRYGSTYRVNILVDKDGGVRLDECAKVNRILSRYIGENGFFDDDFTVEVSSPGLDRKFTGINDYIRCIGRKVNVTTRQLIGKDNVFSGKITEAAGEQIKLLLDSQEELTINLNNIKKAKLEIGWKR